MVIWIKNISESFLFASLFIIVLLDGFFIFKCKKILSNAVKSLLNFFSTCNLQTSCFKCTHVSFFLYCEYLCLWANKFLYIIQAHMSKAKSSMYFFLCVMNVVIWLLKVNNIFFNYIKQKSHNYWFVGAGACIGK